MSTGRSYRRYRFGLTLLATALGLAGCAPPAIQMPTSELRLVRQAQPVYSVHVAHPGLLVMTPAKALIPFAGPFVGLAQGRHWISAYHVPNPAALVETRLAQTLEGRHELRKIQNLSRGVRDDKMAHLEKRLGHHGFVLDASKPQWSVMYYRFALDHYRMSYIERVRLIDLSSAKTVWQHVCSAHTHHEYEAPSAGELMAHDGAILKQFTQKVAQRCAAQLADAFGAGTHG